MATQTFDYVVVGAGSAGCVIAARLAEAGASVALLEAGKADHHPMIHIPAGVGHMLYNSNYNWMYASEPEKGAGDRRIHTPRGKTLGGSSSINGMLYVRGNPGDFDDWAALGCEGWSYAELLPLFKRSESYVQGGDTRFRGQTGALQVENYRTVLPLTHRFVKAAQEAGQPFTPDMNGASQEGVGYSQMTRLGRFRGSTYRAFLRTPAARKNVHVQTDTTVTALSLEKGHCKGVKFTRDGHAGELLARHEVVLCAGSINSPQILQLSGIGDPDHLASIGVKAELALPGVGRNLSDHYTARLVCRIKDLVSINELASGWRLMREVAKFLAVGRGALTFGVTSSSVFCRSQPELARPDLQLLFTPASYVFGRALVLDSKPGMTLAICPTRPASRGTVLAASKDPLAAPKIQFNYLSRPEDVKVMLAGLKIGRRILSSPALATHVVQETRPGAEVVSDHELEQFARNEGASLYHPVGTCKMGIDDQAVVDPQLRLRGISGLRVADASIMPFLVTGNTNAASIVIGEKASDLILQSYRSRR